ncbi:uncharacterized protein LACBIDRAFT_316332 [Laccaria bicolor S238N-H82]|uniref:Predicted protein n=1 Tax=Laccaria bicolor (strain S238N-H82 / ATCC MYA-4686) TaxID=486041 RepID=B0E0Q9_LACBS|nr:uncharacterized protein LACBIDRAFT_316332 [Laccaria bicolor S238N-H82]EDQ99544.1 predicted protein [Laccaria bicolor S238N-H82]|eukprot:XP_001889768.1 predicted protein [Laccaria bicolor S238N-H82]
MDIIKIYGFPMNEVWMVQEGVRLGLSNPEDDVYGEKFDIEPVFEAIRERSGIKGLLMNCVYIGDEFAILFWEIPYQIWKAPRTPKLERRLEEFLQLANLPPMRPAMYASVDGDLLKILRGLKQAPPWIEKLRVESSPLYRPLSHHLFTKQDRYSTCTTTAHVQKWFSGPPAPYGRPRAENDHKGMTGERLEAKGKLVLGF